MRYAHIRTRRGGFTIVEMLVACALAIFLMAVLSEAFVVGLQAFRMMKAMGDMEEQLRQASIILRKDLGANHFEGNRRMRELTPGDALYGYFSYGEGFETIGGTNRPAAPEGGDAYSVSIPAGTPNQLGSVRDTNDWIACTVRLNGNRSENYFYGRVPIDQGPPVTLSPLDSFGMSNSRWDPGVATYSSQWAEVIFFLRPDPMGLTTEAPEGMLDGAGNQIQRLPLYQLFRRQRLLVPDSFAMGTTGASGTSAGAPTATFAHHDGNSDVAAYQATAGINPTWRFTSPADIQFPIGLKFDIGPPAGFQWDAGRRFRPVTNPLNPAPGAVPQMVGFPRLGYELFDTAPNPPDGRTGADLLLNNVVAFDIKVWDQFALGGLGAFVDLGFGTPPASTTGTWTQTPQTLTTRPFGRPPVRLEYPGITQPNPDGILNAPDPTQIMFTNAWVYDTMTRRMGGGDLNHPNGWNFKATRQTVPGSPNLVWRHQEPYPSSIQAIQITIRLWDRKTNQTRQVTIIQDM